MKILKITLILALFSFFCLSVMAESTSNIYNYDLIDIDGNKVIDIYIEIVDTRVSKIVFKICMNFIEI